MSKIISYLPIMMKAIVAGVGSFTAELAIAQQGGITWGEWGFIAGSVAAIMFGTWKAENARTSTSTTPVEGPQEV